MFDTVLGIVADTDWITPLAGFVGDLVNGPSHCFLIPYGPCPYSGRDVGKMLNRRGVKTWGLQVVSGTLMVSVRKEQARFAQHLLKQAGVPVENPLPEGQGSARGRTRTTRSDIVSRSRILRSLKGGPK